MLAFNHIASGASLGVLTTEAVYAVHHFTDAKVVKIPEFLSRPVGWIHTGSGVFLNVFWPQFAHSLWFFIGGCALFLLGCLLPDIDHPKSMLGRHVHVPIKHRTWTHSIWMLVIFGALSWFVPIFWFLVMGIFFHLVLDSGSPCGIAWFYPLSGYETYSSGATVKTGRHRVRYQSGRWTEYMWSVILLTLAVCATLVSYLFVW